MAAPFRFDRTWSFSTPPEALWAVLARTDDYVGWWSWLRELDGEGLHSGGHTRFTIQSPLPYSLCCDVHVLEAVAPARIVTEVGGDLRGPARLEIAPAGSGSTARLVWAVELANPMLSAMARFARPMMSWAHDVVVAAGVEQFLHHALPDDTGDAIAS